MHFTLQQFGLAIFQVLRKGVVTNDHDGVAVNNTQNSFLEWLCQYPFPQNSVRITGVPCTLSVFNLGHSDGGCNTFFSFFFSTVIFIKIKSMTYII